MLEFAANNTRLEGIATFTDGERCFIPLWREKKSQASFYIGDHEQQKQDMQRFIDGEHCCYIDIDCYLKYLEEINQIASMYSSMFYGPLPDIAGFYQRFKLIDKESSRIILKYNYPERYLRILNENASRKTYGDNPLINGACIRQSIIGGITKVSIQKTGSEYALYLNLIENWRERIMAIDNVTVEQAAEIFNNEMQKNIDDGKTEEQSAQIFGIKYCPLLNSNRQAFSYDEVIGHSEYCSDTIKAAVRNGMDISSSVLWWNDLGSTVPANRAPNNKNIILYGVPGCGKSHFIIKNFLKNIPADQYERTVFHPDYTYSDFVGQILPQISRSGSGNSISYDFIPGPFTRIMRKAVEENEKANDLSSQNGPGLETKQFYLIIEELNRGNAPAIFGEIFQLLDRRNGESEYGINNSELAKAIYLKDCDKKNPQKIAEAEEHLIKIPSNLIILATMNTADQNVFTLDTAFKRRWDMINIRNNLSECPYRDAEILDTQVTWEEFATKINYVIVREARDSFGSDDKRLGAYFLKPGDLRDFKIFSEKILLYLWSDAFKFHPDKIFRNDYSTVEELIDDFASRKMDVFSIDFDKTVRHTDETSDQEKINNYLANNGDERIRTLFNNLKGRLTQRIPSLQVTIESDSSWLNFKGDGVFENSSFATIFVKSNKIVVETEIPENEEDFSSIGGTIARLDGKRRHYYRIILADADDIDAAVECLVASYNKLRN